MLNQANPRAVDAEILDDAFRFKMDFASMLEKTLHGQVKIMITQCSMRHLYDAVPKNDQVISHAKNFERRRCNHHELDKPLSTLECLHDVIDPKDSKSNKHRYVVATQDGDVRAYLRTIPGVPMIYLKRSVMIMEPMAGATEQVRDKDEEQKLRAGLKAARGMKRAREEGSPDEQATAHGINGAAATAEKTQTEREPPKKKRQRGPKGPNPLSVKRKSKSITQAPKLTPHAPVEAGAEAESKTRRRRKHKSGKENDEDRPALEASPT